jgi:putative ABC transport system substrate-binding protein
MNSKLNPSRASGLTLSVVEWVKIKNSKLAFVVAALFFALAANAEAQHPVKIPRIGYLARNPVSSTRARTDAFLQGLRELGYVEGKSIVIEWRSAEGQSDRLPELAAELVRRKVDVIVADASTTTRAAKKATAEVPIVMAYDLDPVGNGFVASLARPGGNITGLSSVAPEISGKQIEILKEIVPKLSRVAVFGESNNPGNAKRLKEVGLAAAGLGVQLQYVDINSGKDIDNAFHAARKSRADAVLVLGGPNLAAHRQALTDLALKNRLPAVYSREEYVDAGGLLTYGPSITDLFRHAAVYVDKILKGAKPGDLPVEQPTKFELVINLKTAKQVGLTIPPNVLARADRVIK